MIDLNAEQTLGRALVERQLITSADFDTAWSELAARLEAGETNITLAAVLYQKGLIALDALTTVRHEIGLQTGRSAPAATTATAVGATDDDDAVEFAPTIRSGPGTASGTASGARSQHDTQVTPPESPEATLFALGTPATPPTQPRVSDAMTGSQSELTPAPDASTATLFEIGGGNGTGSGAKSGAISSHGPKSSLNPTLAASTSGSGSSGTPKSASAIPTTPASPARPGVATKMGFQHLVDLGDKKLAGQHERMGRYAIVGRLGKGGMGDVLEARDADLNRDIALKVMLSGANANRGQIEKFLIEGQVTGQLEHPNIVPVHELGITEDGRVYFTMKYVRGRSLQGILKELRRREKNEPSKDPEMRAYSLSELLEIFSKICDGVAFAHAKGVVHRDLKPENVMVGEFGEVLVMDWGLAKVRGVPDRAAEGVKIDLSQGAVNAAARGTDSTEEIVKTLDGTILGTPVYMPPEQARGDIDDIDNRSDIYSLGAILYQILTLETPLTGSTAIEILVKVAQGDLQPPSQRTPQRRISPELEAVVQKAMAHKREHRYQTTQELQDDVRAFLEGRTLSAVDYSLLGRLIKWIKRNRILTAAVCAVILVGAGIYIGLTEYQNALDAEAERKRQAEITNYIAAAEQSEKTAANQQRGGELTTAISATENALRDFDSALALDKTNDSARLGRERLVALKAAIETRLQEQRADAERRQAAAESASRNRERAAELVVQVRDAVAAAQRLLDANIGRVMEFSEIERDAVRGQIAEAFESAANMLSRAEELAPDAADVRELRDEIVEVRTQALQRWDIDVQAIQQRTLAAQTLALAAEYRRDGERIHGLVVQLAAEIAADPAAPENREREKDLDEWRGGAFARLLNALTAYNRATDLYFQLRDDEAGIDAAIEGRRATLLALAALAMGNGEFQLADSWLSQARAAEPDPSRPDPRIDAAMAELTERRRIADGYASALEAGRHAYRLGDFSVAIANFERAREVFDSQAIRAEIERANYALKLRQAELAMGDERWMAARDRYREAAEFTGGSEERQKDLEFHTNDFLAKATAALLAKARVAMARFDDDGVRDAQEALTTARQLNGSNDDVRRLHQELTARKGTPEGFVYVAAGRVALGSNRNSDRNPARTEFLDGFYMARREVTVAEYREFVAVGGYETRHWWSEAGWAFVQALPENERVPANWAGQTQPGLPVVGVSAHEAMAYTAWLTAQIPTSATANDEGDDDGETAGGANGNGGAFRLPTDAEWELVARHTPADRLGVGRIFPWGNDWEALHCPTTAMLLPVGSHPPDTSAFGCHDLGVNASEWVIVDPKTQVMGVRGASYSMPIAAMKRFAMTTKRSFVSGPTTRTPDIGFRLVRTLSTD